MRRASDQLKANLNVRWIDLSQTAVHELPYWKPSLLHFDIKYASKVLHGDAAVLDAVPAMDASRLHLNEALILYFTRLYTLLAPMPEGAFEAGLCGDEAMFFRNQMAKAVLASVDVNLLAKGAYHPSYAVRVERFGEMFSQKTTQVSFAQWALREKLRPQSAEMSGREVQEEYARTSQLFHQEMFGAMSILLNRDIRSPFDIQSAWLRSFRQIIKRCIWLVRFRGLDMEQKLAIQMAQSFIAYAYQDGAIDEACLKQGCELLAFSEGRDDRARWNKARLYAANLRMNQG